MSDDTVLTLNLSLMGRLLKTYRFGKPVITVGRDPASDIVIENPGVSRHHLRFERSAEGDYEVVDLDSANGTFLNELPIKVRIPVGNGDSVRFGKYTLAVKYEKDRRATSTVGSTPEPEADPRTIVLSKSELRELLDLQRKAETGGTAAPASTSFGSAAAVARSAPAPTPAPAPPAPAAPPSTSSAAPVSRTKEPEAPAATSGSRSGQLGVGETILGLVLGAATLALLLWFAFR